MNCDLQECIKSCDGCKDEAECNKCIAEATAHCCHADWNLRVDADLRQMQ